MTRSYVGGWEWCSAGPGNIGKFRRIFRQQPTALKLAMEPQAEALCFSTDGRVLLTVSEGTPTTLYEVRVVESGLPDEP